MWKQGWTDRQKIWNTCHEDEYEITRILEEKQPQKYVTLGIRRRSVGGCGLSVVVVATAKVNGQMELEECFLRWEAASKKLLF